MGHPVVRVYDHPEAHEPMEDDTLKTVYFLIPLKYFDVLLFPKSSTDEANSSISNCFSFYDFISMII